MRFLETLLLVIATVYLAQLLIASLVIATLLLFLWVLYKRPKEALLLGLAVLVVLAISRPIGLMLVAMIVAGCIGWALLIRFRRRRSTHLLAYRPDG